MAAKIAEAKQLGVTLPVEKDAASLTAEAVMRGSDAAPIALSVSSLFWKFGSVFLLKYCFRASFGGCYLNSSH